MDKKKRGQIQLNGVNYLEMEKISKNESCKK